MAVKVTGQTRGSSHALGWVTTEILAAKGDPDYEEILGDDYSRVRQGFPKDYTLARQQFEKATAQENGIVQ